ncbi:hypothetical protein IWX83_002329 [Flavobacterium sp. CG_9.1]|nr:hypothetical protein [Flavobacterium sp. CG_9.1]
MISKNTKIYIARHRGMVGSAVWRILESKGYSHIIGKTSAELNLRNEQAVLDMMINFLVLSTCFSVFYFLCIQ